MPKVTQAHIEKRKSEILEAAERVFKRKGFEPATMQDVVEESGMSRGGVYSYFSNTEKMLQAIHERNIGEVPAILDRLLENHGTVWEALEAFVDSYLDDTDPGFGIVTYEYSVTAWRDEGRKQFMLRNATHSITAFVDFLQKGVECGEFRPMLPLEGIVIFCI
ncbi:MAG TPA: TetR family transcriptional regulator, partial [Bacillales bacterium]|nr:TetR family transcriptional regulator [Bacillales bacterium]